MNFDDAIAELTEKLPQGAYFELSRRVGGYGLGSPRRTFDDLLLVTFSADHSLNGRFLSDRGSQGLREIVANAIDRAKAWEQRRVDQISISAGVVTSGDDGDGDNVRK